MAVRRGERRGEERRDDGGVVVDDGCLLLYYWRVSRIRGVRTADFIVVFDCAHWSVRVTLTIWIVTSPGCHAHVTANESRNVSLTISNLKEELQQDEAPQCHRLPGQHLSFELVRAVEENEPYCFNESPVSKHGKHEVAANL